MRDQTATRRRIIQGASVIGVAGLVGSSLVTAQEETPTPGEESLVRVAHTSPDAPAVDVLLDDSTVLRGLEFGEVSDYAGVQPGSYRLRVVADQAAGLDEQFETDDDGQVVLFDQSVEIPSEQVFTAVAFGLVAAGTATPAPAGGTATEGTPTEAPTTGEAPTGETPTEATPTGETPPGATPTAETSPGETPTDATPTGESPTADTPAGGEQELGAVIEGLPYGEAQSVTIDGGGYTVLVRPTDDAAATPDGGTATETSTDETPAETPTEGTPTDGTPAGTPSAGTGTADEQRPFEVALLADDVASPPQGQARVRVFHAVPDIETATIVVIPRGGGQGQGQSQQGQGPSRSVDLSLDSDNAYSGFATGFFDPQAGPMPEGEQTPETPEGETADERPPLDLVVAETVVNGDFVGDGPTEF